jgi:hypothetical protein
MPPEAGVTIRLTYSRSLGILKVPVTDDLKGKNRSHENKTKRLRIH